MQIKIGKNVLVLATGFALLAAPNSHALLRQEADGGFAGSGTVRDHRTTTTSGQTPTPVATLEAADEAEQQVDLGKIKVPCDDSANKIGMRKCEVVKKEAKAYVQKAIGHIINYYYEGKNLVFDDRPGKLFCVQEKVSTPVCTLGDVKNPEESSNTVKNESCGGPITTNGGYCGFPVTATFSNCGNEVSWLMGAWPQALEHHAEEVAEEIDKGKIELVDYSSDPAQPAKMCIGYAKAITRLINGDQRPGANYADTFIRERFPASELNTQLKDACPRQDAVTNGTTTDSVANADGANREVASAQKPGSFARLKEFFSGTGTEAGDAEHAANGDVKPVVLRQNKGLSMSACNLSFARQQIEALYFRLASCEAYYRAKKTYFQNFDRAENVFGPLTQTVIRPCLDYARSATNSTTDKTGDANFMAAYYKCYKGEVSGKMSAKAFFKDLLEEKAPIENEIPKARLQGPEHEVCPGTTL